MRGWRGWHPRTGFFALGAAALLLASAAPAQATDQIFWQNRAEPSIQHVNFDGSGQGAVALGGATLSTGTGLTIDSATGRLYWANQGNNTIAFASIVGGSGGALGTSGATASGTAGAAIDKATGRVFWANQAASTISFARLDGSGGGNLSTAGAATISAPQSVVFDPATQRIYWTNGASTAIGFTNADGSGGSANLNTTGATVNQPTGLAIDDASGKVYWANQGGASIGFANLDQTGGGGTLNVGAAPIMFPVGVAVDHAGGKIYWANGNPNNKIAFANLDGSGGGTITSVAQNPGWPALLKDPRGSGLPTVTGGGDVGATLTCSTGTWAADEPGALLFQAPASFTYQWLRGGNEVADATSSTFTATNGGDYSCRVRASNAAGTGVQTSATHSVAASNKFSLGKAKLDKKKGTATLAVTVPGSGKLSVAGKDVKPASTDVSAGANDLTVKAKGSAAKKLKKKGKVKLSLEITFSPQGGSAATQTASVTLKKKKK